ncbi:response regulator [bacterium]|nr:response regulator [bacterium]
MKNQILHRKSLPMEKVKILVVEDESIVSAEIKSRLLRLGHNEISIVATGDKAIEEVDTGTPDIVLMDIEINGKIGGVDIATAIRSRSNIPIVFLATHQELERVSLKHVS